jgi:SAM-dependent methyltransferase
LEKKVKRGLNVGSGQRPFNSTPEVEWCNVDSQERWNPDVCCDASRLPFRDNSADYFVLHHVLEHFGCGEGEALINEAHRVLRPGGSLLVFVPDLRALAVRWLEGGLSTQIYVTNLYGAFMGDEADRHRWGFDKSSLRTFLNSFPFDPAKEFDWRKIPGANIARDFWILGAECIK